MCSVLITRISGVRNARGGKFQLRRWGVGDGERETQVQRPASQERVQHVRETEGSKLEYRQQRRDGERRCGRRLAGTRSWKPLDLLKEMFSCGNWETLNVLSKGVVWSDLNWGKMDSRLKGHERIPGRPIRKKVSGGIYKSSGSEDEKSEQSGDLFRSGNAIWQPCELVYGKSHGLLWKASLIMEQEYNGDLRCQSWCLPNHNPCWRDRSRGACVKQGTPTLSGPSWWDPG